MFKSPVMLPFLQPLPALPQQSILWMETQMQHRATLTPEMQQDIKAKVHHTACMSLQISRKACLKLRSSATRLTSAKSSPALLHPESSSFLHCMRRPPICAASRCCSGTDPGCSTNLQAGQGCFSGSNNRQVLSEAAGFESGQPYALV